MRQAVRMRHDPLSPRRAHKPYIRNEYSRTHHRECLVESTDRTPPPHSSTDVVCPMPIRADMPGRKSYLPGTSQLFEGYYLLNAAIARRGCGSKTFLVIVAKTPPAFSVMREVLRTATNISSRVREVRGYRVHVRAQQTSCGSESTHHPVEGKAIFQRSQDRDRLKKCMNNRDEAEIDG